MTCFLIVTPSGHICGIVVQNVVATNGIDVNSPTIEGRSQLDAETVVGDRRNASKMIRDERFIGCAKTINILKKRLNIEQTRIGGRVGFV